MMTTASSVGATVREMMIWSLSTAAAAHHYWINAGLRHRAVRAASKALVLGARYLLFGLTCLGVWVGQNLALLGVLFALGARISIGETV